MTTTTLTLSKAVTSGKFVRDLVVGESFYQDELLRINDDVANSRRTFPAVLIPEENEHDPNAVAVCAVYPLRNVSELLLIGYIPRNKAEGYRKAIMKLPEGQRAVLIKAKLMGGTKTAPLFGVAVDLPVPSRLFRKR